MSVKKLENLLKTDQNSDLDRLIQRAQDMDSLTTALRAGIESNLADNLIAANIQDGGQLAIICSSSPWAARLRCQSESLAGARVMPVVRGSEIRRRLALHRKWAPSVGH